MSELARESLKALIYSLIFPFLVITVVTYKSWLAEIGKLGGTPASFTVTDIRDRYRPKGGHTYWADGSFTDEDGHSHTGAIEIDRETARPVEGCHWDSRHHRS